TPDARGPRQGALLDLRGFHHPGVLRAAACRFRRPAETPLRSLSVHLPDQSVVAEPVDQLLRLRAWREPVLVCHQLHSQLGGWRKRGEKSLANRTAEMDALSLAPGALQLRAHPHRLPRATRVQ